MITPLFCGHRRGCDNAAGAPVFHIRMEIRVQCSLATTDVGKVALSGSDVNAGEGESAEEAARSSQDGQPAGSSRGPSQELQFEGEEEEAGAPAHPRPRRPKYVTPVDELDESDAEAAQVFIIIHISLSLAVAHRGHYS